MIPAAQFRDLILCGDIIHRSVCILPKAQQRRSFRRDFARNGEYREARLSPFLVARFYWQAGSLKLEMVVLQLKVPLVFKYSLVYQNVQLSTGSIAMLL